MSRPNPAPVILLLGPSGSGKSTLRKWLAEDLRLVDVELDGFEDGVDGVDRAGLRAQWDSLYERHDAAPLAKEMRARAAVSKLEGAVLSLPSLVVLPRATIAAAEKLGVFTFVLMGRREECRGAFLERQKSRGAAALDVAHWERHATTFEAFDQQELLAYRLWTFGQRGRVQRQVLIESVKDRIERGAGG